MRTFYLLLTGLFLSSILVAASLPVQFTDQGSDARQGGTMVASADLTIEIWDNATGGNLLFNRTYANAIVNGSWNVIVNVSLTYGEVYYKDYKIDGTDLDFDGAERLAWYSPLGDVPPAMVNGTAATLTGNQTFDGGTLHIDAVNDRVGIGETSPSAKLTVGSNLAGVGPAVPGIMVGNPSSGTAAIWMGRNSSNYLEVSWLDPSYGRIFTSSAQPLILQQYGGNVGIGTTSPAARLDVAGNISASGTIMRAGNTVWDSGNDGSGSGLDADTVDGNHVGLEVGRIYLTGNGTICSTRSGTNVLWWDRTHYDIKLNNTSGDWLDYWYVDEGAYTKGAIASGTTNSILIGWTDVNDQGAEVHFGQADGQNGWCSVWVQYANTVLVGHYMKY